jgi:hypothetical protein
MRATPKRRPLAFPSLAEMSDLKLSS